MVALVAALAPLAALAVTVPAHASPGGAAAGPGRQAASDPSYGPSQHRAAMTRARQHRAKTKRALGLGDKQALVVRDVVKDPHGGESVRYARTYDGLPVVGGDLVVHRASGGRIGTVTWNHDGKITAAAHADVGRHAAGRSAGHRNAGRTDHTREVVFAARHRPVLAWESQVTGTAQDGTPIDDLVYTNAHNGKQLAVYPRVLPADGTGYSLYDGTVVVQTTPSGSTYRLNDQTRGGHKTYDANNSTSQTSTGTLFTDTDDSWGNGSTSSRQSAAVDAAYGAAKTWDFYQDVLGRTGIRNDGVAAYSKVHYGNSYENAFWYDPCFCMTYGDGGSTFKPLVSLDVAGHEMSHGVTSSTAGLVYSGDAGGLNESTSDVMGTMVEFTANNPADPGDYYIGEKIMRDGTFLRRMDDPSADGGSVNCYSSSTKNLNPHYSSGVGNHAFYLLAEGSGTKTIGGRTHSSTTCNGTPVGGIGRTPAAKIWYRALTTYWTSNTTYPQAADGMVRAATDLYGAGSTQCSATVAAWKGVAVTPSQTCGGTPPPTGDNLLTDPGFESGGTGWSSTSGVVTSSSGGFPHSGSVYAWLDGYGTTHTDTLSQTVTIPAGSSATLSFYLYVDTAETTSAYAYDTLRVQVVSGGSTSTRRTYSNLDAGSSYVQRTVDLSAYAGRTVTVKFVGAEDYSAATSFLLDDTSLTTG